MSDILALIIIFAIPLVCLYPYILLYKLYRLLSKALKIYIKNNG